MSLGKRLRLLREKRKWTQAYVSEQIGITNTVLSNYERDYRDPDTMTLRKLAELYEVSSDFLLGIHYLSSHEKKEPYQLFQLEELSEEEIDYLRENLALFLKMKNRKNKNKQ